MVIVLQQEKDMLVEANKQEFFELRTSYREKGWMKKIYLYQTGLILEGHPDKLYSVGTC